MPDIKYADNATAERLSGVGDYPAVNQAAVREMHRQVGDLTLDLQGVATRGLLVRHLVLPEGLAGTEALMQFLANEVSRDTYVNVMDQYHPCHHADAIPPLNRRITQSEFEHALHIAREAGLHRFAR